MKRKVESSLISQVSWNRTPAKGNGNLRILFNNGKLYTYSNVEQSVFHALIAADSVGMAFNRLVRNKYQFTGPQS